VINIKIHWQFGFVNTYFVFVPGSINYEQNSSSDSSQNTKVEYTNSKVYSYKLSFYASDEITFKKPNLNICAHYLGFRHKSTYYQNVEPRIGVEYNISKYFILNMSFDRIGQYNISTL
jgi:hypothetical protein